MGEKYKMTVTNDHAWTVTDDNLKDLLSSLGLDTAEELIALDPGGNAIFSDDETKAKYRELDKKILPLLWLEVMTDNFSDSNALFALDPSFFLEDLSKPNDSFIEARVIMLEVTGDASSLDLSMQVESSFTVDVVDGVDFEYEGDNDEVINDQIRECNNMANVGFSGVDLDSDEPLTHNWEVERL